MSADNAHTPEPWIERRWSVSPHNFDPAVAVPPRAVELHDITVRDGEECADVAFTVQDKVRFAEARTLIHGALRRLRQRGEGPFLLSPTCMAGMLEIARGAAARGVTIIAACVRGEGPIGNVHMPDARVEVPDFLDQARQSLGGAGYATAWAAGQAVALEQAVAYALEDAPDSA